MQQKSFPFCFYCILFSEEFYAMKCGEQTNFREAALTIPHKPKSLLTLFCFVRRFLLFSQSYYITEETQMLLLFFAYDSKQFTACFTSTQANCKATDYLSNLQVLVYKISSFQIQTHVYTRAAIWRLNMEPSRILDIDPISRCFFCLKNRKKFEKKWENLGWVKNME